MSSDNIPTPAPAANREAVIAELRSLLGFVLDTDASAIQPSTCLCDLRNWSSLNFLVIHAGIQKRFHITIDPALAATAETAGDLASMILQYMEDARRDG